TESVNDLPHGAPGQAAGGLHSAIDKRPPFDVMPQITLLLQPAEQCPDARLFELALARHRHMHSFHGTRAAAPHDAHNFILQVRERRPDAGRFSFTLCHGTSCTTYDAPASRLLVIIRREGKSESNYKAESLDAVLSRLF